MSRKRLVGCSSAHRALLQVLSKVAPTDAEVLITGPSGVGKELYAEHLHSESRRRHAAFVPVNCGALPDTLLENELFGHVGGAFTGARTRSDGLVVEAEGGTLFLDEVNSLSAAAQVKMLRFLQAKEYRRLGESRLRRADVRVVAATNVDLLDAVRDGDFREDLFFRLRVIPVKVPSLAERPEDIEPLLDTYVRRYADCYELPPVRLSSEAREILHRYSWPGNVRELENCVRYLTCLQLPSPVEPADLPLLPPDGGGAPGDEGLPPVSLEVPLQQAKRELVNRFERTYLEKALRSSGGNIAQAARRSHKPRRAFFELLRKHNLHAEDFRGARLVM